jgi:hypothetical protein
MMQLLFPTPVFRIQLGLTNAERQVLKDKTFAVYGELDDLDIDFAGSIVVVEWGRGLVEALAPERLEIDIETDGSIEPREALASAGDTLRSLVDLIANLSDEPQGLALGVARHHRAAEHAPHPTATAVLQTRFPVQGAL